MNNIMITREMAMAMSKKELTAHISVLEAQIGLVKKDIKLPVKQLRNKIAKLFDQLEEKKNMSYESEKKAALDEGFSEEEAEELAGGVEAYPNADGSVEAPDRSFVERPETVEKVARRRIAATDPISRFFQRLKSVRFEDGRKLAVAQDLKDLAAESAWAQERADKYAGLVCTLRGKDNKGMIFVVSSTGDNAVHSLTTEVQAAYKAEFGEEPQTAAGDDAVIIDMKEVVNG